MANAQMGLVVRHIRRLVSVEAADELTDGQLLERFARRREQEAFATLLRRHGPMVLGVCRRVLRHLQDAEDAFQATFLVLARKADSIHKRESVGSWLHGVAQRLAVKALARRERRQTQERRAANMRKSSSTLEIAWQELQTVLDEEIGRLPDKYRAPLVLCYLEGKTHETAARQLGWRLGTVAGRLARGRDLLRSRLGRRGLTLSAGSLAALLGVNAASASLPATLLTPTLKAAVQFAAGKAAAAVASAPVAALVDGGLKAMLVTKLKTATAILLAVSVVTTGTSLLARRGLAAKPPELEPPKASAQKAKPADEKGNAAKHKAADPAKETTDAVVVSGRVLDPNDKPFAGAKLRLWTNAVKKQADMPVLATTRADGHFRLQVAKADLERGAKIVARAKDHGPDWMEVAKVGKDVKVTLRLVKDDVPISGRLVDLEGQPIAGVTVQVSRLEKRAEEGDLTPWIATKQQWARRNYVSGVAMMGLAASALDVPSSVTTGKDGTFGLTGFGRERVVHLSIRGKGIEHSFAEVITRAGLVTGLPAGSYAATFRHPVGPSKPIVGTVKDKRTGKPLAGIIVNGAGSPGGTIGATIQAEAITDATGRYSLDGVGKHEQYWIAAGGMPYFNSTKLGVKDTAGVEPVTVDFNLERGVVVHGRLTDKATGKLVKGSVTCLAMHDNPNLKDFTELGKLQVLVTRSGAVAADGSFSVIAVPGPGLLAVKADDADRYCGAVIEGWDGFLLRTAPGGLHPSQFHAVIPINPVETDAKSTHRDIALEPGRTRIGTLVGPDGQPLAGAHVAGLTPLPRFPLRFAGQASPKSQGLKQAEFTAVGLNPRKPRNIVFFHPEKKLGKIQAVRGDETDALTVRLEPLGGLTGRIVDAQGRPWAGLTVRAELTRLITAYKDLPWELLENLGPTMEVKIMTDSDGKFRLDGLLPGLKYNLIATDGEVRPGVPVAYYQEGLPIESGKTTKLGDLKSKLDKEGKEKKRE